MNDPKICNCCGKEVEDCFCYQGDTYCEDCYEDQFGSLLDNDD